MFINGRSQWKILLDLVYDKFNTHTSDEQRKDFAEICDKKFMTVYVMSSATIDDMQTAIQLMMDFAKDNDVEL